MKKLTLIVILVALVLLVGYDIVAYVEDGTDATISAVIWGLSHEYPIVTLAAGVLIGHLFWNRSNES